MEWLYPLVPVLVLTVLHYLHHSRVLWWEVLVPIVPAVLLVCLTGAADHWAAAKDWQRQGGWVVTVTYYEAWDEYIQRTCTYTVNGQTRTRDCSYVQQHSEYWEAVDSNGHVRELSRREFDWLVPQIGPLVFVDMRRPYHQNDGDAYRAEYVAGTSRVVPVFLDQYISNPARILSPPAGFRDLSAAEVANNELYEWPRAQRWQDHAVLPSSWAGSQQADEQLTLANAKLSGSKQLRLWVLLFEGKPRSTGLLQQAHWKGGKPNEFVVCIGVRQGQVTWCHPFCLSPDGHVGNQEAVSHLRSFVERQQRLQLDSIVAEMLRVVPPKWRAKDVAVELAYVRLPLSAGGHFVTALLTVVLTVATAKWAIDNDSHEFDPACSDNCSVALRCRFNNFRS